MEISTKSAPIQIKQLNNDGTFEGYGSVFGNVDSYKDVVAAGAFKKTLSERNSPVKLLWQHDTSQPIGVFLEIKEDEHGLYVKGQLALEVQKAKEAYELMKVGAVDGLSIGYSTVKEKKDVKTGIRYLTELKLYEVSVVTFPANEKANVVTVKSAFEELTEDQRIKVLDFITSLKSESEPVKDDHSAQEVLADTKEGKPQEEKENPELMHLLDQLITTIKEK